VPDFGEKRGTRTAEKEESWRGQLTKPCINAAVNDVTYGGNMTRPQPKGRKGGERSIGRSGIETMQGRKERIKRDAPSRRLVPEKKTKKPDYGGFMKKKRVKEGTLYTVKTGGAGTVKSSSRSNQSSSLKRQNGDAGKGGVESTRRNRGETPHHSRRQTYGQRLWL